MKGNVINLNTLHLNSVRLNGIGKVQSVSLKGGSTEDPVFPPVEPPVEPEPTPTYTLSASVTNGMVSATRNGSAVNLPFTANEGDVIVVEVTPNDGYAFEGWNDGNTDNPRSITMQSDVTLSAECVAVVVKDYIQFADAEVERVLIANGVSSDGVGITMEDAAKVTNIASWFNGNTAIESFDELDYFTGVTSISSNAFNGCANLQKLIFRYAIPPTLGASAFANTSFPIYVPDASLEAYKTATNWKQYADRIHPLSEIEDYYVSDALLMHLDGINKGNVEGEWQDLVSGNTFVNHGAIAEADGWGFDGASSYMDSATLGTIGWWNKARTLEVVVKFDDISENRTEVVFLSRKNCMAFGRYKSEHFVNSAGLSVPSIKIQSDNGKVIYGYCGNSTSYVRSIINGQQGATSYGNSFSGFLETTAYLGKRISNDDYFKGKIHAIRIHDRILSEEEILYNQRIDNKRFNLGLDI